MISEPEGFGILDFPISKDPGPLSLAFVEILCDCGFYCSGKTDAEVDQKLKEHRNLSCENPK